MLQSFIMANQLSADGLTYTSFEKTIHTFLVEIYAKDRLKRDNVKEPLTPAEYRRLQPYVHFQLAGLEIEKKIRPAKQIPFSL